MSSSPTPGSISDFEIATLASFELDGIPLETFPMPFISSGNRLDHNIASVESSAQTSRRQSVDLSERPPSEVDLEPKSLTRNVSQLPPTDRGRGAWGFVLGATLVEGLTWGFVFSFGVFQKYLSNQGPFKDSKAISSVGTVTSGIAYLSAPFVQRYVTSAFPARRQTHMVFALFCCVSGCIAASFSEKIWQLILSQGLVVGVGVGLLNMTSASLLNEWFSARRGLACGIVFGGGGAFGIVLPPFFEKLFTLFGYANTLRIYSAILALITLPSIILLMKPRLPSSQITSSTKLSFASFKHPLFLFVAFSNLFQGLGYFIPGIYLPSYASDLNIPSLQATLLLSLLNLSLVFDQIGFGALGDRLGPTIPLMLSAAVAGLSVTTLWGLSKSFPLLTLFSIIYGASAGGYSVLWSKIALEVSKDDPYTQLAIWGFYTFERGIGNIISGPVSASLMRGGYRKDSYAVDKYEYMIIFTGAAMAVSALGMCGSAFRRKNA